MYLISGLVKLFSCSIKLSTKFILLINVKMPTIVVGILTFISRINTPTKSLTARNIIIFSILALISSRKSFITSSPVFGGCGEARRYPLLLARDIEILHATSELMTLFKSA